MNATPRHWDSLHIFIHDHSLQERFLCDVLAPLVAASSQAPRHSAWFFIRYWEGGPHLRLRIADADHEQSTALRTRIGAALPAYCSATVLDKETFYRGNRFEGRDVEAADQPWYDDLAVAAVPYVPELRRYGGDTAPAENERLFEVSSEIAVQLVRATRAARPRRLALAAAMLAALAGAARPAAGIAPFLRAYGDMWTAMLGDGGERPPHEATPYLAIAAGMTDQRAAESNRTPMAVWRKQVADAAGAFGRMARAGRLISPRTGRPVEDEAGAASAIDSMLMSQAHMLNNRLGIAIEEERALAHGLAEAFAARLSGASDNGTEA